MMTTSLEKELKNHLKGAVHFDEMSRKVYSVDASIFEVEPLGIIIPQDLNDLHAALEIARHFNVPLTVRGAATGISGGCLGRGIIVDVSKFLNSILEINCDEGYAICEPGVIQDHLNTALENSGYRLGPETSTGNRATLGGMLANNASGPQSLKFGKMSDNVLAVDLLLSTGEWVAFSSLSENEWNNKTRQTDREGAIYRALDQIKMHDAEEIKRHFPPLHRRVSGYNLDFLLQPYPLNTACLIAGSEGTLGIATKIKMKIVPRTLCAKLLVVYFSDIKEAFQMVPRLLEINPIAIELIDDQIIHLGRESPLMCECLEWLEGNPKALLIIQAEGKEKIQALMSLTKAFKSIPIFDPKQMSHVWKLRKSGLGILLSKRSYTRAIAFIEDLSIPPVHLAAFIEEFTALLGAHHLEAGIYGHAGAGCLHIRPFVNLKDPSQASFIKQIMLETAELVLRYGGTMSGEHGDGLIRSWLNPKLFGEKLMQSFSTIKEAFDPVHLMNPGIIIPSANGWEELRSRPGIALQSPKTFLDFSAEGGFELAADLCNGNGLCRKKEKVMCPSFQATNDEFHSTRARAGALRSMIHQRLPLDAFESEGMHAVMDLCISCKGCKTECPSLVDMAKFKSEFLYHYQKKHGISLRTHLFGNIGRIFALSSPFASVINTINQSPAAKWIMKKIGISSRSDLPSLSPVRFSSWFKKYSQPQGFTKTIILLNDTFTEFTKPEIGIAATRLLNALGFAVILPPWRCCGRPALSKGLLPLAQKQSKKLIEGLMPYTGYPIIGLEPSCILTVRDDYSSLIGNHSIKTQTLDEFLAELVDGENFPSHFQAKEKKILVHGHCYQKALVGMLPTLKVLNAIPGFSVREIPSGCCGMAGSFGYESEHVEISNKIGELVLFPAIRESHSDVSIVASGVSCRHQIKTGTKRNALHLAEILAQQLT